jgi:hypothetical protein
VNGKLICRETGVDGSISRLFKIFLLNVCASLGGNPVQASVNQQPVQCHQAGQVDTRRTDRQRATCQRIKHPSWHLHDDASVISAPQITPVSSLLDLSNTDLVAEVRMPAIVNFQFLPDMGRMTREWL